MVLIPLVQGRFLFQQKDFNTPIICLNPFGSGTFFIQLAAYVPLLIYFVLIPLVQGRFLFFTRDVAAVAFRVLIPLVQGRFLFSKSKWE